MGWVKSSSFFNYATAKINNQFPVVFIPFAIRSRANPYAYGAEHAVERTRFRDTGRAVRRYSFDSTPPAGAGRSSVGSRHTRGPAADCYCYSIRLGLTWSIGRSVGRSAGEGGVGVGGCKCWFCFTANSARSAKCPSPRPRNRPLVHSVYSARRRPMPGAAVDERLFRVIQRLYFSAGFSGVSGLKTVANIFVLFRPSANGYKTVEPKAY